MKNMKETNETYHIPVLYKESIKGLNIKPAGIYIDATFGGGGHSKGIINHLNYQGHLYGFDQDAEAEKNSIQDPRFTFIQSNFRYIQNFLQYHQITQVDGILADLGVSSHHFDEKERGFSFRLGGSLDMRMNQKSQKTAEEILNTYEEKRLADIFYRYGELRNSRKIASSIIKSREKKQIDSIESFIELISPLFSPNRLQKDLAKVFQALRIEVNEELLALEELLISAEQLLKKGGRLVIITYHSLEDRIVKNVMKSGNIKGIVKKDFYGNIISPYEMITGRVITPDEDEIKQNSRARSAKLRIAEKK